MPVETGQQLIKLEDLHQFDNFEILAKQVVEGTIIGLHKSPFHGFSVEFAEHRLFNNGDPLKNIDWKVYGRTDKLFVKRFEEETNLRCRIILDVSSSMYYPIEGNPASKLVTNKLNFSAVSAAALMHIFKKQRDAVGLSMFTDELLVHTNAKSTTKHHNMLLAKIEELVRNPEQNRPTDAAVSLHRIADDIHKRSLVILFSDMFDKTEDQSALFDALQHLKHAKHEVIVFHVGDYATEIDFEFDNRPYHFVDMETGEEVKLTSNKIKQQYKAQMEKRKSDIYLKCAQFKIDFVEADIRKDFTQILLPYLNKRTRMNV